MKIKYKKIIKYTLISILALFLFVCTFIFVRVFVQYKNVTDETPVDEKVENAKEVNDYVPINEISDYMKDAIVAVEDHRFYSHFGIDVIATTRVVIENILSFSLSAGGSTITQQVARNFYFSQDKLFSRKVAELLVAFELESNYEKDKILELYLNIIYFGNGQTGIKQAAKYYFDKEPKELTLEESVYLAGLPQAPSVYSKNSEKAELRSNQVLDAMVEYKYITTEEAQQAKD